MILLKGIGWVFVYGCIVYFCWKSALGSDTIEEDRMAYWIMAIIFTGFPLVGLALWLGRYKGPTITCGFCGHAVKDLTWSGTSRGPARLGGSPRGLGQRTALGSDGGSD
jgi:hypothetical protein